MSYFDNIDGIKAKDTVLRQGIEAIKQQVGYDDIYGLEFDFDGNYVVGKRLCAAKGLYSDDFDNISPWKGMKRCNLADDGTVNAYYGDVGYIEDGSNGQVMVEIPKFYYRFVPVTLRAQSWDDYEATAWVSGTSYAVGAVVTYQESYYACITANSDAEFTPAKWHEITELGLKGYHIVKGWWFVSPHKHIGFKTHPLFVKPDGTERAKAYISAYEGCLYDVSESKYLLNDEQVANVTATTGDKLSSIGGTYTREYTYNDKATGQDVTITVTAGAKPASGKTSGNSLTRHNCTVLAQNRGTGWQQQTIKLASAIQLLFAVKYANFNWQATIGGGVTTITDNSAENCASFIGSTASLGNSSGAASSTIDYTGTAQTTNGKVAVSENGVENFFGNIWKFTEGINLYGVYNNGGGEVFICTDEQYADNKITDNYESAGFTVTNKNQYIKYFGYGGSKYDYLFLTSKTGQGASTTLPVGDYTYVTANLNGHRVTILGSYWDYSGRAGGYYWFWSSGSGGRNRNYSARLAYLA